MSNIWQLIPVTLVINISLLLVAKSSVIDDECSLQHGQQLHEACKLSL